MVSQYSVNEQRGSVYIYVLCTTGLSLYFNIINGRLEASGIESVLVCLPVFPPQLVLSDQDFPQSTRGGRLGQKFFFKRETHGLTFMFTIGYSRIETRW